MRRRPEFELGRFNEAGPQGAGKQPPVRAIELRHRCFNEAGPQGAGKPVGMQSAYVEPVPLQ